MQLDIDRIRNALPIRDVCRELGIDVNGTGFIKCRSHSEKNGSCKVYPDHLHCHGCGWHADSIALVQHETGVDFWGALSWISERAGLPRPQRSPEAETRYRAVRSVSEIYVAVMADALKNPEPGLKYLEDRGIPRTVTEGVAGYLPADYHPANREEAGKAGLYSKTGNFLLRDGLVIPIYRNGTVVSLYGRLIRPDEKRPTHCYPATTEPPMPAALWGLHEVKGDHAFLCESIIDAMTLAAHGFPALAAFGTQGLTADRVDLLKGSRLKKITFCFDSDSNGSGQKGALKAGEALFRAGLDVEIIALPLDGKEKADPNSYFQEHGAEEFRGLERRDYFSARLDEIPRGASVKDQAAAARPLILLVAELQDELLDKGLLKQIAQRCPDLSTDVMAKRVKEHRRKELGELPTGADFLPDLYADEILKEQNVIHYHGGFHFWKAGCYHSRHELLVMRSIQALGRGLLRKIHIDDVVNSLKIKTYVPDDNVNQLGIINLQNGYLDLSEKEPELHPHSPELFSTLQLPILYDENAECPLFMKFLEQKVPDETLRLLVQEMFGYLLEPSTRFQKGFAFIGKSGTGKSTLLHILRALIGTKNCSSVKLEKLGDRFRVAALDGKLVNISSEVSEKAFLDDGIVKAVLGGDVIDIEKKHQDTYNARIFARLVVAANHFPLSHDTSEAFFRRWIPIPFNEQLDREQWDNELHTKIIEHELPGVLLFALAGLARLRTQNDFTKSEASIHSLDEWKRDIDPVQEFAHLFLKPVKDEKVPLKTLFESFHEWAGQTNRKARFTDKGLKKRFEGAGFTFKHTKHGVALEDHWLDFSLNEF